MSSVALLLLLAGCCAADEAPPLPKFYLSAGFSSDMVLQQAPAKAAIYGVGEGPVTVTVSGTDAAGAAVLYTVRASVNADTAVAQTWKAFLKPTAAGGSFTVTVKGAAGTVVLDKVTFGDIYFCSGRAPPRPCLPRARANLADTDTALCIATQSRTWRLPRASPSAPTRSRKPFRTTPSTPKSCGCFSMEPCSSTPRSHLSTPST